MEFYDGHFSYVDLETNEEKFVVVVEQGGGSLIPESPLSPGALHTVARGTGDGSHLGLYRLETQVTAGNGSLKLSGFGSNTASKESVKVGFDYFRANANQVQAPAKPGDHDYHLHVVEAHNTGPSTLLTLAGYVALCAGLLSKVVEPAVGGARYEEPRWKHRPGGESGGVASSRCRCGCETAATYRVLCQVPNELLRRSAGCGV